MVAVAMSPDISLARDVEIEVGGDNADQLSFRPIRQVLRGRADFALAKTKSALALRDMWPEPVPGKIVGITAAGGRYVREPLYDPQYAKVAQRIKNKGSVLPDERQDYQSESLLTWLYWMRRAVDSGIARVVKGELPELAQLEPPRKPTRDESKPRKGFVMEEPTESPLTVATRQLAENAAEQTAVLKDLKAFLAKLVK